MTDSSPPPAGPWVDFVAGTIAGIAGLIVGQPLDTVKVRLQTRTEGGAGPGKVGTGAARPPPPSSWHVLADIVRRENVRGLYAGLTSPLAGVAVTNAAVFGSYGVLMRRIMGAGRDKEVPSLSQVALAGTGTGVLTSFITAPIERIKIIQQCQPNPPRTLPLLLDILRIRGVRGLYRGLGATMLRDTGYGAYFGTYEGVCRYFHTEEAVPRKEVGHGGDLYLEAEEEIKRTPWYGLLIAGAVAGVAAWIVTFPLDVVKTRIQSSEPYRSLLESNVISGRSVRLPDVMTTSPVSLAAQSLSSPRPAMRPTPPSAFMNTLSAPPTLQSHPYRTVWSTIRNSYHGEGWRIFWVGVGPTMLRAVPVNAVTFGVFEVSVALMNGA